MVGTTLGAGSRGKPPAGSGRPRASGGENGCHGKKRLRQLHEFSAAGVEALAASGGKTAATCRSQEKTPDGARLCEHTFVTPFRYTVAEHDQSRPWVVVGEIRHLTVDLDRAEDFADWAAERWPQSRYTAQLDPGQDERRLNY